MANGLSSRLAPALLVLLLATTMAGCVSRNETKIAEAQAKSDQARYDYLTQQARADGLSAQAAAAAVEAQARAEGLIGVAQANSQTAIVREQEKTERETAWLSTLPWLLLIALLCGGVVGAVWLVLWFRGKSHLVTVQAQAQAQALTMLPGPQSWPALPQPHRATTWALPAPVDDACRRYGAEARPDPATPGAWLLLMADGRQVRMLPGPAAER